MEETGRIRENLMPRPEYPRPQMRREGWMNLNGEWEFEMDPGVSGVSRGLPAEAHLKGSILVPFCPESRLSGVGYTDFVRAVWYRRTFTLPEEAKGKEICLHFGAADYRTEVYVNGTSAGVHEGGYTPFEMYITGLVREGENTLTVFCSDDTRDGMQPSGKQSERYESYGCFYTRTTGIWQTVWLEWVNPAHMVSLRLTPDLPAQCLHIRARLSGAAGCSLKAAASYLGEEEGQAETACMQDWAELTVPLEHLHLWEAGNGRLYDLKLELKRDGRIVDTVQSYFGMRSICFDGMRFLLNGKPVFQRLVLDQGFYPDGIYTAPSDYDLRKDIELSQAMGFNGARLHQKVFEPRFLYWADRLGYLCWGEMASWGLDVSRPEALAAFLKDWIPEVERDYSSPSVIGWCPFNETWDVNGRKQDDEVLASVYRITKALDPTRPVIDTSGNYHVITDIYDVHDYEQNPAVFASHYGPGTEPIYERMPQRQTYTPGLPVFVSEYGGIQWSRDPHGWGYGNAPGSEEEFIERLKGLTDALLDNPDHFGFCYTQLTDVEQEQNGLYTYERVPKFSPAVIRAILGRKAAMEKTE